MVTCSVKLVPYNITSITLKNTQAETLYDFYKWDASIDIDIPYIVVNKKQYVTAFFQYESKNDTITLIRPRADTISIGPHPDKKNLKLNEYGGRIKVIPHFTSNKLIIMDNITNKADNPARLVLTLPPNEKGITIKAFRALGHNAELYVDISKYTVKNISLSPTHKVTLLSTYTTNNITLNKTQPPLPGNYQTYRTTAKTDSHVTGIKISKGIKDLLGQYKNQCKKIDNKDDLELPKLLEQDDGVQQVLTALIKKQNNISCCDNVDLSNHVLKTSIVPCSNVIPDKYKKYGENYDPNKTGKGKGDEGDGDGDGDNLHPSRIHDKFSIGYISLISLIGVIIIMNIM